MTEYATTELGALAAPEKGSIAIGPFGSRMKADVYTATGVPVIRGTNIGVDKTLKGDWVYVPEEFADGIPNCIVQPGDLVFPHRGAIGEVALIPDGIERIVLSSSMMKFRADRTKAVPEFLYYYFKSRAGRAEILRFGSQVGTPGIGQPLTSLKKFVTPLPEPKVQADIARLLASLDDKIELNRRMNETLEELGRALFRDWFVDFGPTRRQADGATEPAAIMGHAFPPEKAANLAPLFPDKLGDNGLPKGWETRDLRSALTLNYGKSLTKKARKPGPFNVFGSGGISGTHDTALAKGPSIIVGRKGTVGSLYWTREDFYAIDTVFYVTSNYPMVYCHRLLETLGLETMNTDAAVPGLNRDNAYRQEFAFCGNDIIDAFAEFVGNLTEKSDANEQENQTLAEMRDLLLPNLMSGKIRLNDVGAAV